ncbi:mechanosensitive ion channel family protein [Natronoglycomyces albus]|uniref:Mechanosensitive ion channel n=1 Tax=Natronoglycomyces albus TaxID=2811108 RepID=A0A895XHF4_9ACTN|nr:mechanosensitive ion channel domain-containing protein [Natronoglycomyces albus]QSB05271.1 mechanosensitive ion channel [Natronoglycomyces albus]
MLELPPWIELLLVALASAAFVSLLKLFGKLALRKHKSETASRIFGKALRPGQLMAATGAIQAWISMFFSDTEWSAGISKVMLIGTLASGAWLATNLLTLARESLERHFGSFDTENIDGRRRRTQINVMHRLLVALAWTLVVGVFMWNMPNAQAIGASLLAGAGLAGIIAALAAQTMLSNLFAGISLAFGDALRLEDVVVVEGEWGWIEEITLSYVVVRIWDERRLVLPTSYFKDNPYVNWTRHNPALLGTVYMDVDWRLPVDEARRELRRVVSDNPLWDGRRASIIVEHTIGPYMQIRLLISAANPDDQWELRCEVREAMIKWIVANHPHCVPRMRVNTYQSSLSPEGLDSTPELHMGDTLTQKEMMSRLPQQDRQLNS